MKQFKSNGKLLLTGEYVVLDGALALAVPSTYGQSLNIESINDSKLIWESYDENNSIWYHNVFELKAGKITSIKNDDVSKRLLQILNAVKLLNPDFLVDVKGFKVSTHLEFPKYWGLGTSSTLIHNISQWTQIDPYELLNLTFGGSGYDIACAKHDTPITYKLFKTNQGEITRDVNTVDFNPEFKEHLYFVYLNKKQNSRDGIAHYKSVKHNLEAIILKINSITKKMISCNSLIEFQNLMEEHETIISKTTQQNTVKSVFFSDFNGAIKSLGAWGGDLILVASEEYPSHYFKSKGFDTIIPYTSMVK